MTTHGSALWPAVPGPPDIAGYLTTELATYVRLLNEEHAHARAANAEAAMAALLATLEDQP